jgi:hypothetical protein
LRPARGDALPNEGLSAESPARGNTNEIASEDAARVALGLVVATGIVLRVAQFLSDRSLWHDEALLALNLIERPFSDLIGQLHFGQAAPVPFLAGTWLVSWAGGDSEPVLRLIPLVAGILATVLFAVLARKLLGRWTAVVATVAFVAADALVYYASELKPYSTDVLVTVVLLLVAATLADEPSPRRSILYGVVGVAAILWSFPSVFVAGAIVVVLITRPLVGVAPWRPGIYVAGIWTGAVAMLALSAASRTDEVRSSFGSSSNATDAAFGDRGKVLDLDWLDGFATALLHAIGTSEERPASHLLKVGALAVVLGLVALLIRRRWLAVMLALPFLLTLLASRLELYPITERTTLFLVPLVALLLAEGASAPARWIQGPVGLTLSVALVVGVLVYPVYQASAHVANPRVKDELRPVLEDVAERARPGDTLYLHSPAQYAFRYYADCSCLAGTESLSRLFPFDRVDGRIDGSSAIRPTGPRFILSTEDDERGGLRSRLEGVHGRLWVVYSHVRNEDDERFVEVTLPQALDRRGMRLAVLRKPGATAYLYALP